MRLRNLLLAIPAMLLSALHAHAQAPAALPLELRLTAKRTTYPLGKGPDKTMYCFVAIDFELKNASDRELQIFTANEPELELIGPRPESVRKLSTAMFYVIQESPFVLGPGKSRRGTFRTLTYHVSNGQYRIDWLEPGEYTLRAFYRVRQPDAKGAFEPKGPVTIIRAEPLKLRIENTSLVGYWVKALDDEELRGNALVNLSAMGAMVEPAATTILALLGDPEPDVRVKAIQIISSFRDTKMVVPTLLRMLDDGATEVKLAAIQALVSAAPTDPKIGADLRKQLKHSDAKIRAAAAQAWHDMPYKGRRVAAEDTAALLEALRKEQEVLVRRGLIAALCHHPSLEVLAALVPHIKSQDKNERLTTLHTLGRLGPFMDRDPQRSAQLGHPIKQTISALIEAMRDHESMPTAVYALASFRADSAAAVPALLEALDDGRNQHKDSIHHPRVWIVQAFRDIGPGAKAAQKALAWRMLTDPDYSVRQYAAQALAEIGAAPKVAGPALNQALKDQAVQVRNEVPRAMVKIGAIDAILDGLNDENAETRAAILRALGEMKSHPDRVVPAVTKAMREDKVASNRVAAASTLGLLKAVDAIKELNLALKDKDSNVRLAAIESLRSFGPDARASVASLIDMVKKDESRLVREKACWCLVWIGVKGEKALVPIVVDLLTERDAEFVAPAIALAGQLGPDARAAVTHLRRIAQRTDALGASARDALRHVEPNP